MAWMSGLIAGTGLTVWRYAGLRALRRTRP